MNQHELADVDAETLVQTVINTLREMSAGDSAPAMTNIVRLDDNVGIRAELPGLGGPPMRLLVVQIDGDWLRVSVRNISYVCPRWGLANRVARMYLADPNEEGESSLHCDPALLALHVESWGQSLRQPADLLLHLALATNDRSLTSRVGLDENDGELFVLDQHRINRGSPSDLECMVGGLITHARVLTQFVELLQAITCVHDPYAHLASQLRQQQAGGECRATSAEGDPGPDDDKDGWL
jgi:hypothetical protein